MITFLVHVLIVAIILGLILWLVMQIPFLAPFANIIRVVAITIFVLWIIITLLPMLGIH